MPTILFYFDFVSPYAYIAFHQLPQVLGGLAWQVQYEPVVLGGLFKAQGNISPASIPAKHAWIQRHVHWLAAKNGLPLIMPARHPFKSIAWLRMALASSVHGRPSRQVCEIFFNAIWQHGDDPDEQSVQQEAWMNAVTLLPSVRDAHSAQVKQELIDQGQLALARGVFGVPSFVVLPQKPEHEGPQVFWGVDSLAMLRQEIVARQGFDALVQR